MIRYIKLDKTSEERVNFLDKLEIEYNLKFPEDYRNFFINYELDKFEWDLKDSYLAYKSIVTDNYYEKSIGFQEFSSIFFIEKYYKSHFGHELLPSEGTKIVDTFGSTFLLLIANIGSPDYGKVVFYDLEMHYGEVFILGNSFTEFLGFITEIPLPDPDLLIGTR